MKLFFLFCFSGLLLFELSAGQQTIPKFPNIGYLGRGYDYLLATPRPTYLPIDAGFASSIFDMTIYDASRLTADGRHLVPDYSDIVECTACQLSFNSYIIDSPTSYRDSLGDQVKVDSFKADPYDAFNYRASKDYIQITNETLNDKNVFVDTAAACIVYCAELRRPLNPSTYLDDAFTEAVRQLPVLSGNFTFTQNISSLSSQQQDQLFAYLTFLHKYGTHFVSSMKAGSLYWQRATFTATNYTLAEKDTAIVGFETAASLAALSKFVDPQSLNELQMTNKFQNYASITMLRSIGAIPPVGRLGLYNTTSRWLADSRDVPMPVEFQLTPISDLFVNGSFPLQHADDIAAKQVAILEIVENGIYCSYLANYVTGIRGTVNCGPEATSVALSPSLPKTPSNFGGTYYKAGADGIKDIANQLTGVWDCPTGYSPILIGGGPYKVESWPGGNCFPPGTSQSINQPITPTPTIPGYWYLCRNNATDPQGAFFGFYTAVNSPCWGTNNHWRCAAYSTCCSDVCRTPGSSIRDGRNGQGQSDILVAYYGCEYIYVSFTKVPGAFVGGFYLIDSRPNSSWVNPATGVTSCPTGYKPYLLFSQQLINPNVNIYPFESYVCLLQAS